MSRRHCMEPPAGGLRCGLKFAYREAQRQTLWELFLWDWSLVIPIPTAYSRINTTNEPNSTTQRRIETGQSQTIYATWVLQPITLRLNRQISSLDCTFDWQLLFTWLPWLPLRLSKRQSPLPTTVLLRTTFTHDPMGSSPGSNNLLFHRHHKHHSEHFNLY